MCDKNASDFLSGLFRNEDVTYALSVREQKEHITNIIEKIKKILPKRKIARKTIAITTDTHGDFASLLGSLLECGAVIVKDYDYCYYDLKENKILTRQEFVKKKIDETKSKGEFCIIPTPYVNPRYMGNFYHLGDIIDRGKESLTSLLFLYQLYNEYKRVRKIDNPIHIAIGNHETSASSVSNIYTLVKPLLVRMIAEDIFDEYLRKYSYYFVF